MGSYRQKTSKMEYILFVTIRKMLSRFSLKKYLIYKILSRTKFQEIFFKGVDWSSTETSLEKGKKSDFDNEPVLKDENSIKKVIKINYTENLDLSWALKILNL